MIKKRGDAEAFFGAVGCGFAILALIVGIVLFKFVVRPILWPVRVIDKSMGVVEGTIDKTLTADNAIYNYEWFKQQKADIEAVEQKITQAQDGLNSFEQAAGARSSWSFEDKTEDGRLRSVVQGLQSQYRDMVATYNARSSMATRSIFQDGKIPQVVAAVPLLTLTNSEVK